MSNTVCCFHFSIVNQGKNISEAPKELEHQPCRKFESCMIGKTGGWYLRKNLVLFWPPDMQKTPEFRGFWGWYLFCSTLLVDDVGLELLWRLFSRVIIWYLLLFRHQVLALWKYIVPRNTALCFSIKVNFLATFLNHHPLY